MTQSRGIEQVLELAVKDPDFRAELGRDRLAAVDARGLALSEAERKILAALWASEIDEMIEALAARAPLPTAPPHEQVLCGGIRPDEIPQQVEYSPDTIGPAQGIRPDRPSPVRGTRPGRILLAAAATTAIAGGGYYGVKALTDTTESAPAEQDQDQDQDQDPDGGVD